jgi:glyoxylase-like metal-dependent hydrolase (beta-lactamase superfamily II)
LPVMTAAIRTCIIKLFFVLLLLLLLLWDGAAAGAEPRFEKVNDHCYNLQVKDGANVGVVVTDDGVLMVNPPQEEDRALVDAALTRITSGKVRWLLFTGPEFSHATGALAYAQKGAQLLVGARLRDLSERRTDADAEENEAGPAPETKSGSPQDLQPFPWLVFGRQMHLFPSDIEIRIMALRNGAHTGGDIVAYVPSQKVLFAGALYKPVSYPDIDVDLDGSALGWLDGFRQVIDSIPVLKPANAPAKPEPKRGSIPEEEKTLEEGIAVVPAYGTISNLQDMKDLLETCQKLRKDVAKAVRAKRSCDLFLASPASDQYRVYSHLDRFAELLFEELSEQ